ncbi:gliding motility protein GldI [Flavobacterium akiainvivens]|uniref:Peptidyl-prolyl cis-trans isomerase n=1 Tax=Flavobacterium akiainvivens TaxID=1202724 RepID=A0A0M8MGP9_9FLAO|nr:gliding motility-associated peptidyl-prolyl isomerase GldI [Flavobacterium akiainvivens]KOS05881.1 gliding motility protein GldI [Flavobacterium akiainvivens]SFQ56382.1 protein involved in gliding motility GldI [Flavobacterium akiainvivens]
MKKVLFALLLATLVFTACSKPQARRAVSHKEGTFMQESIDRNKKLVATEEKRIDSIIKSNPSVKYTASAKGYWYHYIVENTIDTVTPKEGDVAYFTYDVKDLKGKVIYTEEELQPQVYHVDKQNIMMGISDGIKLMNRGEKVTFIFPSHMGYGYHGDNDKIGTNEPLVCTVTLTDIKQDPK